METAEALNAGRGLQIRQDRDLLDTNYGPYSGKNWEELDKQGGRWARYMADPHCAPKGAESFAVVLPNCAQAISLWFPTPYEPVSGPASSVPALGSSVVP